MAASDSELWQDILFPTIAVGTLRSDAKYQWTLSFEMRFSYESFAAVCKLYDHLTKAISTACNG